MTAHNIAQKFRRALRNETGATFTHEQLREMARCGVLHLIAKIETEELCPETTAHTEGVNTGSRSAGMDGQRGSGKSLDMNAGRSFIAALARAS